MAKLRIQAPFGKTLLVDVQGADPADYDSLAAAALADYKAKSPEYQTAAQNLAASDNGQGAIGEAGEMLDMVGNPVKAGGAGIADVTAGNGLQQASTDISKVLNGEKPETAASNVGEFVGSAFTPGQIATAGGVGVLAESLGLGEAAATLLKGWAEKQALNAIGVVKTIAKGIGLDNLGEVAQFVLNPVQIGDKTLPAIVTATSTTSDMLGTAQAIMKAAGTVLGKVSGVVDEALTQHPEAIDLKGILESLDKMKLAVQDVAPELGKAVVAQYDAAIDDFLHVVQQSTTEANPSLFSDLRELKTTIGDLVYKHGNPLTSKAALEDAYSALSKGIDAAAHAADSETGAAFAEANAIYNKAASVVDALEGKVAANAAKSFWTSAPALSSALLGSFMGGPMGAAVGFGTAKAAEAFGPQAIASGLGTGSRFISPVLQNALTGMAPAASAVYQGLSQ